MCCMKSNFSSYFERIVHTFTHISMFWINLQLSLCLYYLIICDCNNWFYWVLCSQENIEWWNTFTYNLTVLFLNLRNCLTCCQSFHKKFSVGDDLNWLDLKNDVFKKRHSSYNSTNCHQLKLTLVQPNVFLF